MLLVLPHEGGLRYCELHGLAEQFKTVLAATSKVSRRWLLVLYVCICIYIYTYCTNVYIYIYIYKRVYRYRYMYVEDQPPFTLLVHSDVSFEFLEIHIFIQEFDSEGQEDSRHSLPIVLKIPKFNNFQK